jgi:hypothetical protein
MADAVKYKGLEIYADGFGKEGGDRWQPTLYIVRRDEVSGTANEKQYWPKYLKQFYPTRDAAAKVALIAGKAIIDGKMPGTLLGEL